MSWRAGVEELEQRRAMVRRMGAPDKVARHVAAGKLPVRERIAQLLDDGSFREIGSATGTASYDAEGRLVDLSASNFLFGRGRIEGRPAGGAAPDSPGRGGEAGGPYGG